LRYQLAAAFLGDVDRLQLAELRRASGHDEAARLIDFVLRQYGLSPDDVRSPRVRFLHDSVDPAFS
jgi:hypothetical protein